MELEDVRKVAFLERHSAMPLARTIFTAKLGTGDKLEICPGLFGRYRGKLDKEVRIIEPQESKAYRFKITLPSGDHRPNANSSVIFRAAAFREVYDDENPDYPKVLGTRSLGILRKLAQDYPDYRFNDITIQRDFEFIKFRLRSC